MDALWGETPPATAEHAVQVYVSNLRKIVEPPIESRTGGYLLAPADEDVDAWVFERLSQEGRQILAAGEAEEAARILREALDLWRDRPLADLSDFGPSTPGEDRVAAIRSLGLTYSLLTRYTSFVAVQEIVRRTSEDAVDVDQPLPLPAGVSDLAVGVTSGSEPDIMWLAALLVASLGCVNMMRRLRRLRACA